MNEYHELFNELLILLKKRDKEEMKDWEGKYKEVMAQFLFDLEKEKNK